jgi:hypothetical protein
VGNDETNEWSRAKVKEGAFWTGLWPYGLAACLIGCSSAGPTPREQCFDYQSAFCEKAIECAQPSERADLSESCEFAWQVYSFCDRVRAVLPQYDACMKAIHAVPCSLVPSGSLPDAPDECRSVFAVDP